MKADTATAEEWKEYDAVAEHIAKLGQKGKIGDHFPSVISSGVVELINQDPEAFEDHVKNIAYALAMHRALSQSECCQHLQ